MTETHFDGEGAYSINAEQCTGEPAVATTAVAEKTYHPYIITLPEITWNSYWYKWKFWLYTHIQYMLTSITNLFPCILLEVEQKLMQWQQWNIWNMKHLAIYTCTLYNITNHYYFPFFRYNVLDWEQLMKQRRIPSTIHPSLASAYCGTILDQLQWCHTGVTRPVYEINRKIIKNGILWL